MAFVSCGVAAIVQAQWSLAAGDEAYTEDPTGKGAKMSDKVGKADIAKALGMAQLQGAKEVFKEQMKEGMVGALTPGKANPQVTTVMDQVAKAASAVRLNIQRRDPVSGKHTYLRGPGEVDAQLLLERGLARNYRRLVRRRRVHRRDLCPRPRAAHANLHRRRPAARPWLQSPDGRCFGRASFDGL